MERSDFVGLLDGAMGATDKCSLVREMLFLDE